MIDTSQVGFRVLRFLVVANLAVVAGCGEVTYAPVCHDDEGDCSLACDGGDCGGDADLQVNCPDGGCAAVDVLVPVECDGGACTDAPMMSTCDMGQSMCGAACFELEKAESHCGKCGNACGMDQRCQAGKCRPVCPEGQDHCGGDMCLDLQNDPRNCGMCGKTCSDAEDCVAGMCKTACRANLRQPMTDDWGIRWDGLERAADTQAVAETTCTGIGGRLPMGTELFRVSATQSATVGQTTHVNPLWSGNPFNNAVYVTVQLSNGVTALSDATTKRNYRCVCPPPAPKAFTGAACHGPPNAACFALGKRYNMDVQDRAAMPQSAAMWECAQVRGHLPESVTYIEAIQSQLPNGSNAWLHSADEASYYVDIGVKWQNTQPIWTAPGNAGSLAQTTSYPFRCVGLDHDPGVHPHEVPAEFVGPTSLFKGETADNPPAAFPVAHDVCFDRGGHLARSTELGELIMQGLPNGSGAYLWTSDQAAYYSPGGQFLVKAVSWTGVSRRFKHYHTGVAAEGVTWIYKTTASAPFRCIYYPIDKAYNGPNESDCQGGCMKVAAAGSSAAQWFDKADRPASDFVSAVATCRLKGGRLVSERDMTEAIRHGLPGGSGAWLMTWDMGDGARPHVVKWTGVDTGFTDQYPTYSTWIDLPGNYPFRCTWTNELR